jgi:hypothetical protein
MAAAQPRLVRVLHLPVGECVTLRPIGPRDAGVLQAYVRGLSPDSRYHRFFGALYELPPAELDRVIHLDRKYELALLAETLVDSAPIVIGGALKQFRKAQRANGVAIAGAPVLLHAGAREVVILRIALIGLGAVN